MKSKEYDPPIAHAEQLSLKNFAKKMNIDIAPATAELNKNGVKVANPDDSLSKIAKDNRTSPVNLYILIKKFEALLDGVQKAAYTVEMVDERFAGKGMGKKKLAEVCQEIGVDLKQAKERLAKSQVPASDEETLHDLAGKDQSVPHGYFKDHPGRELQNITKRRRLRKKLQLQGAQNCGVEAHLLVRPQRFTPLDPFTKEGSSSIIRIFIPGSQEPDCSLTGHV